MRLQKRKARPGKMDKLRYELEDSKEATRSAEIDMRILMMMFDKLSDVIALSPELSLTIANIRSRHPVQGE
jgi:negative regulator of genetic competence, sporulation and motility